MMQINSNYNNLGSCQTVVPGTSNLPDFYRTPLHLPQHQNTHNFVGNQVSVPMQSYVNNATVPVFSFPMMQQPNFPVVGLNSNVPSSQVQPINENNAGNMTVNPNVTPPQTTQFHFPTTSPLPINQFPTMFAPQTYYSPTLVAPMCYPSGNECMGMPMQNPVRTPPLPSLNTDVPPQLVPTSIPQPAGYFDASKVNDSGQSPGLQPMQQQTQNQELWKNDPAQTPVQQVIAIPNYSQPGTYYLQTTKGLVVELSNNTFGLSQVSSEATTRSVSPSEECTQNQPIQNFGNVGMEFVNQQSNNQLLQQNFAQLNLPTQAMMQQTQNVALALPLPQQEALAMSPQSNYTNAYSNQDSHRGSSDSSMNRSPPGFMEGYKIHRVQNVARENQNSNNFESQAQPRYGRRTSDDVRRNNGQQNRRNDRKRTSEYGRRNRNAQSPPVPMVNSARQNKRPRKEKINNGNKTTKRRTKRYGYRTKQDKIESVYARVTEYFSELGLLVPEDHGIRGETVARVHIKKWLSLVKIEEAIAKVQADPRVQTLRVSAPVSMKNQYQKKGFLLYWQTETVEGLNHLMGHFRSYDEKDEDGSWKMDEFQKISVAVQVDQNKLPITAGAEQMSSPCIETAEPKASLASAPNACATESNTTNQEFRVPLQFAEAKMTKPSFMEQKADFSELEKLAFDDEEDDFFGEKIAPPMIMKMSSNCSVGA